MAKFGTFKFGTEKFGVGVVTPFNQNMCYNGIPLGLIVRRQINKEYIYRYCQGHQFKYAYFVPTNPQTVTQQNWRAKYTAGNTAALALSSAEREPYIERAKKKKGWNWHNAFMSDYLWTESH